MLRNLFGRLFGGHRRTRPALHQTLEKMIESGSLSPKDTQAVQEVLKRPLIARELAKRLNRQAQFDPNVNAQEFDVLETAPTKQRPVLQWLWNNRQTILGIIWTLLSVFGIKLPPLPAIGPSEPTPVLTQPAPVVSQPPIVSPSPQNPPATGAGPQPVNP